jgi:tetratricopeptide (TPR) repeat protein
MRQAADLFLQIGDQVSHARMVVNHAHLLVFQERHSQARDRAREALALFRAVEHLSGEVNALNTIGWCGAQLGDYQEALESCEQALDLLRGLGDRFAEASTLDTIAYIHRHLGQHARGLARYEQGPRLVP